jgi:hypothetical protein
MQKMAAKFSFFSGVVMFAFLQGFLRKTVCRTWFFDGESWWNAGKRW